MSKVEIVQRLIVADAKRFIDRIAEVCGDWSKSLVP
jgi:hypothetical protein